MALESHRTVASISSSPKTRRVLGYTVVVLQTCQVLLPTLVEPVSSGEIAPGYTANKGYRVRTRAIDNVIGVGQMPIHEKIRELRGRYREGRSTGCE